MATGRLGKPAIISYESKNRRTGLTDITVSIIKPDQSTVGPFPLVEYASGFYRYSFSTTLLDPEGDYLGIISSPTEVHSAQVKLSLFQPTSSGGAEVVVGGIDLKGKLLDPIIRGYVMKNKTLVGKINNNFLKGKLEGKVLTGKINNTTLIGRFICPD